MKVLIIEDEKPAAEKLERLLGEVAPEMHMQVVLPSVKKSVNWLQAHPGSYELLFVDIQLADGLSFEIFKEVRIDKPVIFTTAYNEYAMEAFKVNSIDYLLKPITAAALRQSLNKLDLLRRNLPGLHEPDKLEALQQALSALKKTYKTRFMVKLGEHIRSIATEKVAFFFAEGRTVFLHTLSGRKFIVEYKLEELEGLLDPRLFFRLNRSFIVNINAITDVLVYSGSRLRISTEPEPPKEIIVSRERVGEFKDWFNGME